MNIFRNLGLVICLGLKSKNSTPHILSHPANSMLPSNKRKQPPTNEAASSSTSVVSTSESKKKVPYFRFGLLSSMKDPDQIVAESDRYIIIKDKYPKAKFHFLALPKEEINSISELKRENLDLLRELEEAGRDVAAKSSKTLQFRYGYHSWPSMNRLHLHVISQDFDSECLKTKKHWLSFTSEFFKDSADVIREISDFGKATPLDKKRWAELQKESIRCNACGAEQTTMPALKTHLTSHPKYGWKQETDITP